MSSKRAYKDLVQSMGNFIAEDCSPQVVAGEFLSMYNKGKSKQAKLFLDFCCRTSDPVDVLIKVAIEKEDLSLLKIVSGWFEFCDMESHREDASSGGFAEGVAYIDEKMRA